MPTGFFLLPVNPGAGHRCPNGRVNYPVRPQGLERRTDQGVTAGETADWAAAWTVTRQQKVVDGDGTIRNPIAVTYQTFGEFLTLSLPHPVRLGVAQITEVTY